MVFDRDKLRSQGVDLGRAGQDLSTLLGGDYVNRFSIQGRSYKVIPQVKRVERLTPDQLSNIYVSGSADQMVPLSTFATLRTSAEPRQLKISAAQRRPYSGRYTTRRFVGRGANVPGKGGTAHPAARLHDRLRGRVSPTSERRRQISRHLPALCGSHLSGIGGSVQKASATLSSFIRLRPAGDIRCADVFICGLTTLNIYSQIGLITLVGLVSKNGILIVEFANHLQETGKDKLTAVIKPRPRRPILMTTAATVVGHFPLVLAKGPGAERATASASCW